MRNALVIGLVMLAFAAGGRLAFGQAATDAAPAAYNEAEAYAVYSAVIRAEWPARDDRPKKYIITAETTDYRNSGLFRAECLAPGKGEEATYAPVIAAFTEVNERTWLLQPKFDPSFPYQLVPRASINSFLGKKGVDGWKEFYTAYPDSANGVITMSAVGFNADKAIALIYVAYSCGRLCAGGRFYFMQKSGGKWAEAKWNGNICAWSS